MSYHGKSAPRFQLHGEIARNNPAMSPSESNHAWVTGAGEKSEELEIRHDEWKFRAPYKVHDAMEGFQSVYEASCQCGRVVYHINRDRPVDAKYCHCITCQTLHGACFQWAAIFHKEDINFAHGHNGLTWYSSREMSIGHSLPCKVLCDYCHSPIMDEGRNMILLFPPLIKFKSAEDRRKFDPTCHMFYSQRLLDIPDGKPKWSGLSGESELIEDSPSEAVEKRKRETEEQIHCHSGESNGKKE